MARRHEVTTTLTGARPRYRPNRGRRAPLTRPDASAQVQTLGAGEPTHILDASTPPLRGLGGPGGPVEWGV
jgi:hypothetical protein